MIRENDNKQESSDTVMEQHKFVSDKIEAEFLTCERIVVFVLLMVTAGMMGAYIFVCIFWLQWSDEYHNTRQRNGDRRKCI